MTLPICNFSHVKLNGTTSKLVGADGEKVIVEFSW
jgi:hypothetical protein